MAVIGGSAGKQLAIVSHTVVGFRTYFQAQTNVSMFTKRIVPFFLYKAKGDCVVNFFEFLGDIYDCDKLSILSFTQFNPLLIAFSRIGFKPDPLL